MRLRGCDQAPNPCAAAAGQSVEAARECGMRAVVVAGRKPLYEMGAADLVVRGLDELSFVNLKQLFSNEEAVAGNVRLHRLLRRGHLFLCARGWPAPCYVHSSHIMLLLLQGDNAEPELEPEMEPEFSRTAVSLDYWPQ